VKKNIYVVLTQTSSVLSAVIKIFTRNEFNHSSISLSESLDPMWSFGRRQPYNPFWGGFVKEFIYKGTFYRFPKTKCAVYRFEVNESVYDAVLYELNQMYSEKEKYGYDFLGLCLAAVHIPLQRKRKYYCSGFIRSLFLKCKVPGAETLGEITKPCDFISFPGMTPVYKGLLKDYPNSIKLNEKTSVSSICS